MDKKQLAGEIARRWADKFPSGDKEADLMTVDVIHWRLESFSDEAIIYALNRAKAESNWLPEADKLRVYAMCTEPPTDDAVDMEQAKSDREQRQAVDEAYDNATEDERTRHAEAVLRWRAAKGRNTMSKPGRLTIGFRILNGVGPDDDTVHIG